MRNNFKELIVSTRTSKLAVHQTNFIINQLKKLDPKIKYEINHVTTKGDKDNRPFYKINQTGIFEKEVNEKLLQYKADFAVHSLKDLHEGISEKLEIACIPKRESPYDVFINTLDNLKINELHSNSIIGTSSIRRAIQIKIKYPRLKVKTLRGNVETRISKSKENQYNGLVLAEAGVKRLNLKEIITQRLNLLNFTPAPGQGALAIVCRKDDTNILNLLKRIEHYPSKQIVEAERALIKTIGAGCTLPIGALGILKKKESIISLYASIYSVDGKKSIKVKEDGDYRHPDKLGDLAAKKLIENGAFEITKEWTKINNINKSIVGDILNES